MVLGGTVMTSHLWRCHRVNRRGGALLTTAISFLQVPPLFLAGDR